MEKYKLQNEDYELIQKIIKITNLIENLYKKLYELEINNKKDSNDFKNYITNLKNTIKIENKIYKEANLDYLRSYALANYILNFKLPDNFLDDIESIMKQDYNNRVLRRILNVLYHNIVYDNKMYKEKIPSELLDLMKNADISNIDSIVNESIYSNIELRKAFEKDILSGYLVFLQEYINNSYYKAFENEFIFNKYNTSFINKIIENDIINDNFNIQNTFYINSRLIADLTETDLELYEYLKNDYGLDECAKQIAKLIKMSDKEYNDKKNIITSLLRECYIRSTFLLLNDESILDINSDFHDFIESDEYVKNGNNYISEGSIIKCFKLVKKDRNIPKIISLN